jgi:hypothetical protein
VGADLSALYRSDVPVTVCQECGALSPIDHLTWCPARFVCDWTPDDLNPGPDCPYCRDQMCARLDGFGCHHDIAERHGYQYGNPGQGERERIEALLGAKFSPDFGTADEVAAYLAERGETVEDHQHLMTRWDPWEDWGWNPHGGKSVLLVCNVPDCWSMWTLPVEALS